MKAPFVLLISVFCFSFCPTVEKVESVASSGFYIYVEDFTDRTSHKYIVETKDSVNHIFNTFFNSELELGEVDRPISIYNGKRSVYIARVNVIKKPDGKLAFKHLKYPKVYHKRLQVKPVVL